MWEEEKVKKEERKEEENEGHIRGRGQSRKSSLVFDL